MIGILTKQKAVSMLNQLYTVETINESHLLRTHKTAVHAQLLVSRQSVCYLICNRSKLCFNILCIDCIEQLLELFTFSLI